MTMVRIFPEALWHIYKYPKDPRVYIYKVVEYITFRYRNLKDLKNKTSF